MRAWKVSMPEHIVKLGVVVGMPFLPCSSKQQLKTPSALVGAVVTIDKGF